MKTFPKPLTQEEEKYFLQKYKEGDMDAKRILIERNLRLVAHVAKKYQAQGEEPQDLIAVGTIGLIKAVSTFDQTKKNKLVTYAARCVENELLMLFRSRKKFSKEVSLQEPIGKDKEGNEICFIDVLEEEQEDIVEKIQLEQNIKKLYESMDNVLTKREQDVIRMRYGLYGTHEMTQKETAKNLGLSRSYVSRIEKNAVQKLRRNFEGEKNDLLSKDRKPWEKRSHGTT